MGGSIIFLSLSHWPISDFCAAPQLCIEQRSSASFSNSIVHYWRISFPFYSPIFTAAVAARDRTFAPKRTPTIHP